MTPENTPFDRYALPPLEGVTDAPVPLPVESADPADPVDGDDDTDDTDDPTVVSSAFEAEVAFFSEADLEVEPVGFDADDKVAVDAADVAEEHEPADESDVEDAYFAVGYDEAPPVRRPRPLSPLADAANVVDAIESYTASVPSVSAADESDNNADAVVFATAAQTLHDDDAPSTSALPIAPPPVPKHTDPADEDELPDFLRPDALEAAFGIKPGDDEHMSLVEPEPHITTVLADELPPHVPDRPKPTVARTLAEIPVLLVVAALIAFLVKTFLAQAYYIPSGSMLPQLQIDDRVVVSKLAYKMHDPRRGDIVVFDDPRPNAVGNTAETRTGFQKWVRKVGEGIGVVQPSTDEFIKRVIGLPGDKVSGHDGFVFINGHKLLEPYLPTGVETSDFPAQTVAPGRLWVMGDNRGGSADSRVFGQIKINSIVGRAVVKVWPFDHISFL